MDTHLKLGVELIGRLLYVRQTLRGGVMLLRGRMLLFSML